MSTLLSVLTLFLAFFFSSFILWRRLREDYPPGKIFFFTIILSLGGVVGNFFARYLLSSPTASTFSFWFSLFLVSLLILYLIKKLEFRLFEVLDSLIPSVLLFMFIYSLGALSSLDRMAFVETGLALLGLITYRLLRSRYRRFSWYPSGKVGFLGLATLGIYFFARFLVAIFSPIVLSFSSVPKVGAIISLALSLFFLFVVYLRSGRVGAEKLIIKFHFVSIWRK